ncbi:hypothetical protein MSPP1_002289 [Malassezia sp. CBS 17886]|nr:hypothetical protein MSPP1_002289 [Malassezia sp. CBS 17886]
MSSTFSPGAVVSRISALPLGTRIVTAVLIAFSATLAVLRWAIPTPAGALAYPFLVLVPGVSYWYPWTLLTAAFCETTVIEFLMSLFAVPLASQFLEKHWDAWELLQFSAVVVVVSNGIAWFIAMLLFFVTRKEFLIFGTQYHGMEALQTAYLVAFAQLIPQHQIQLLGGRYQIRVRELPMLYVGFSNVMCIFGWTSPFILIQFGWLVAYVYLRFYQLGDAGLRGDRTDAFAFVHWFPPFVHKPVGRLADFLFYVASTLRVIPRWQPIEYVDLELSASPPGAPRPTTRAEAERRRAMALQALDQRLATFSVGDDVAGNDDDAPAGAGVDAVLDMPLERAEEDAAERASDEHPSADAAARASE